MTLAARRRPTPPQVPTEDAMTIGFKTSNTSAAEAWRSACRAACGLENATQSSGDAAGKRYAGPPIGEENTGLGRPLNALLLRP